MIGSMLFLVFIAILLAGIVVPFARLTWGTPLRWPARAALALLPLAVCALMLALPLAAELIKTGPTGDPSCDPLDCQYGPFDLGALALMSLLAAGGFCLALPLSLVHLIGRHRTPRQEARRAELED